MSKNIIGDRLLKLKEEIDNAKEEKAGFQGQLKGLMDRIKKEYGCDTLEEAEKYLNELREKKKELEKKLNRGIEELEQEYGF